jgi:hypothetical protein
MIFFIFLSSCYSIKFIWLLNRAVFGLLYGFILRMEPPSPQSAKTKKGEAPFTFFDVCPAGLPIPLTSKGNQLILELEMQPTSSCDATSRIVGEATDRRGAP